MQLIANCVPLQSQQRAWHLSIFYFFICVFRIVSEELHQRCRDGEQQRGLLVHLFKKNMKALCSFFNETCP